MDEQQLDELAKTPGIRVDEIPPEYEMPSGPWVPLSELRPGALFVTLEGVKAVKSEYSSNGGTQCQCVLLESGEYAHFKDGNATAVCEIGEKAVVAGESVAGQAEQSDSPEEYSVDFLGNVAVLIIKPGDIIVLKCESQLTAGERKWLADKYSVSFPGHDFILLDGGKEIGAIRLVEREKADERIV